MQDSLILNLILRLELSEVNGQASDSDGSALEDHHGYLELGDEIAFLLDQDGVGVEEIVFQALADTKLSSDLILKGIETETQCGEPVVNLREESPTSVGLQGIVPLQSPLINGAPQITLK